jgi:3-oxoacyl-[acyl-carrier protein] reductase
MNVIVTGASRGIGWEVVRLFALKKRAHILAISRNKQRLDELKAECSAENSSVNLFPVPYDLTRLPSDDDFVRNNILPHFDHVDILINNAGYLKKTAFGETLPKDAEQMLSVNFVAPAELIRRLIPHLGNKGPSHVVNISSMGGIQGSVKFSGMAYYSACKSAIATLTECLAEEFREASVFFNCLAFGAVQTEMLTEAFPGYKAPLTVTEAADFVVYFAMEGHKFFNGKILPVSVSTP